MRNLFRTIAVVEAITWAALLVAMFFKWVVQEDPHAGIEGGVPYAGMAHGIAFIAYVVVTLWCWRELGWSRKVGWTALACGIPPFATIWFERRADRRGLLTRPEPVPVGS